MRFQTCYLAHPAERKHERHIETTTEAAEWAKRSFGYVPGSDQEGGTLSRSAEQAVPSPSVFLRAKSQVSPTQISPYFFQSEVIWCKLSLLRTLSSCRQAPSSQNIYIL